MAELFLDLDGRSEPTKSRRLQAALRDAVRSGRLEPGDRLPSSRSLAADLGWARNVVVAAYDQLAAEGYLIARVGDGTRVATRSVEAHADRSPSRPIATPPPRIDLQPGLPDPGSFPLREWRRSLNSALNDLSAADLGYTHPTGAPVLREAVARHLARTRAVNVEADQVLITTGVSASLRLVAAELGMGTSVTVAVEDPGAYTQWDALRATGADVVAVPVDEYGIEPGRLAGADADIVVVTPAHQYPLGGVLPPERRLDLIAWARDRPGRLVIEDDYDAEFRYDRQPVGAMAGVAPDVVAHTGSVSKSLAPALRVGWLCLPGDVTDRVATRLANEFVTPDVVQQHALADLLTSGSYDRIVRTRRHLYRSRRQNLIDALAEVPGATVAGTDGGLHLTLLLPPDVDDRALSRSLLDAGIDVPPLARYRLTPGPPGLVASFASLTATDSEVFARRVAQLLPSR